MLFDSAVLLIALRAVGSDDRNRWRLRRVISPISGSRGSPKTTERTLEMMSLTYTWDKFRNVTKNGAVPEVKLRRILEMMQ